MVQFLSIKFLCWISSIFVGVFQTFPFFVSPCIMTSFEVMLYRNWTNNSRSYIKRNEQINLAEMFVVGADMSSSTKLFIELKCMAS